MARIPHGQPNQAFPSSSCSVILVTFPPPPRLFLSLPAVTARSLSFQMFRHACRLASIRILRKQTKEPRRLRETARETTSSEPNSCNISSPYPATREIRLLLAPDESVVSHKIRLVHETNVLRTFILTRDAGLYNVRRKDKNRTMQREAASRACGKRGVLCTVYVSSPLHWPTGL